MTTPVPQQSSGHKERAADKRVRAMDLRKRGVSFRNIGRALDISGKTAHQYVTDALRTLATELKQETAEHVTLELARYDDLLQAVMPAALAGDLQAVDRAIKLSEARRKLLGLDEPTKIDWRKGAEEAGLDPDALLDDVKQRLRAAVLTGAVGGSRDGGGEGTP